VNEETPPDPAGLQERLHEASRLSEEGRWVEAFEILVEEEREHPRDATLLCMLGAAAAEVDAAGLAYDYFRRCLAEQPTDPFLLVPLGLGLARYDDPDAEGVLRLAALTAPDLAVTRLHYGAYLAREGQYEVALAELEAAKGLDESDPTIARELGAARLLAGRRDAGVEELERAAGLSDDGEVRFLYGLALLDAGRTEEAAEELHRAALALAGEGEVQLATALSCAAQGWWDEAWDALARADVAEFPADSLLKEEVEEALEGGEEEAAEQLLREELAPSLLHARLLERP